VDNVSIDPGWIVAPLDVFHGDIILNHSEKHVLPLVPAYVDIVCVDHASQINGPDR